MLPELNITVDGYLERNGEQILFEFWGCYWHGHTYVTRTVIFLKKL